MSQMRINEAFRITCEKMCYGPKFLFCLFNENDLPLARRFLNQLNGAILF